MCLSPDSARLPPRQARQPGAASPLSLWLLVIPSAQGSLKASPDRAETSPDCWTFQLTCRQPAPALARNHPGRFSICGGLESGHAVRGPRLQGTRGSGERRKGQLSAFEVRSPEETAPQLEASKAAGAGGLVILEDPLTFSQRSEIATLASRLRLPAVYGYREFAEAGGLISYGTNHGAQWPPGSGTFDV